MQTCNTVKRKSILRPALFSAKNLTKKPNSRKQAENKEEFGPKPRFTSDEKWRVTNLKWSIRHKRTVKIHAMIQNKNGNPGAKLILLARDAWSVGLITMQDLYLIQTSLKSGGKGMREDLLIKYTNNFLANLKQEHPAYADDYTNEQFLQKRVYWLEYKKPCMPIMRRLSNSQQSLIKYVKTSISLPGIGKDYLRNILNEAPFLTPNQARTKLREVQNLIYKLESTKQTLKKGVLIRKSKIKRGIYSYPQLP